MVIQIDRSTPAFAALEDIQSDFAESESSQPQFLNEVELVSGKEFVPQMEEEFIERRVITLQAMTIRRDITAVPKIQIAQNDRTSNIDWKDNENLPTLNERKKLLAEELSYNELDVPTPREVAKKLVEEELENTVEGERHLTTKAGGVIVVKKPSEASPSPYVKDYQSDEVVPPAQTPVADSEYAPSTGIDEAQGSKKMVKGFVQINGVEMGPSTRWKIYREYGGKRFERGAIDIGASEFRIEVENKKGFVVAELEDHFGKTYGRGRVSIESDRLDTLNIQPVVSTASISANPPGVSGDMAVAFNQPALAATYKMFGSDIHQLASGEQLDVSTYNEDSRIFVEAESAGHFATVALGRLDQLKSIPLYTVSAMKAFYHIVKEFFRQVDVQNFGILWGQVFKDGKPLKGAQVELASGEGRLVYFNEIGIPRGNLNSTTDLGQFAAVNVPEGIQSVRVRFENQVYPAQIIPSYAGKISELNLEVPSDYFDHKMATYSLLDPQQEVSAAGRLLGLDQTFELEGLTSISLPTLNSGVLVEFDGGPNFELLRTHLPKLVGSSEIRMPLVPMEWVENLVRSSGNYLDRRLGWAIGFVDGFSEVRILGAPDSFHKVIYFDQNFNLVSQGNQVPASGGFLAFNLPQGFQSIEVRNVNSSESYVESFISEPHFLHLIGSQRFIEPLRQENL